MAGLCRQGTQALGVSQKRLGVTHCLAYWEPQNFPASPKP